MSSKFTDLLKQLQEEYDNEVNEVSRLRAELAKHKALAPKAQSVQGAKPADSKAVASKEPSKASPATPLSKKLASSKKLLDLNAARSELQKQVGAVFMLDGEDGNAISLRERMFYRVENLSSMYENLFFFILIVITTVSTLILGILWKVAKGEGNAETENLFFYCFDMFQVIATGGIDDSLRSAMSIIVFIAAVATGLIIFAILIGIITDKFQGLIDSINEGKSTVPETNHTLLLGWNESTERVVCQLAFLRRQYILANSGFMKKMFPWLRTPPATPVAKARIVILADNKSKAEMHEAIEKAFEERGISPKRTRVGWDVICRVGDPTNPQDLNMVGAHQAVAIAVMMTEHDLAEEAEGGSANAATFRTVLALRKVLFAPEVHPPWKDLRIVVPLSRPSKAIHSAAFSAPTEDQVSRQVVLCQDLSLFLNTLIFTCSTQPGLADVFMELMSFDGVALRLRKVKDFPEEGAALIGKTFHQMSHRWANAILVGVVPSELMDAETLDAMNGMAPDGLRAIMKDDRLLFISAKSLPTDAGTLPPRTAIGNRSAQSSNSRKSMKILVCGFRKEWKDPVRFAYRIAETGKQLADGSAIHFLNQMQTNSFLALMDRVCQQSQEGEDEMHHVKAVNSSSSGEPNSSWMLGGRINLSFTEGDSTMFDTLEEVMVENGGFDVTIVVPPVDSMMSAQAQDTRLMTIMCTLRTICENNDLPAVHVIGENKLESSAQLALRPKLGESIDETDFVNVQAIIARAMCQAMAFPFMQPAVVQLFSSEPTSPCIFLSAASIFVPLRTEMNFSDLIEQVKKEMKDAICIGYRINGQQHVKTSLCPSLDEKCSFREEDVIIVIARQEPGSSEARKHQATSEAPIDQLKKASERSIDPQALGAVEQSTEEDAKSPDKAKKAKVKKKAKSTKAQDEVTAALVDNEQHTVE